MSLTLIRRGHYTPAERGVLAVLEDGPATGRVLAEELSSRHRPVRVQQARAALVEAGLVEELGDARSSNKVWRLVAAKVAA